MALSQAALSQDNKSAKKLSLGQTLVEAWSQRSRVIRHEEQQVIAFSDRRKVARMWSVTKCFKHHRCGPARNCCCFTISVCLSVRLWPG